jgi:hypothetical protein
MSDFGKRKPSVHPGEGIPKLAANESLSGSLVSGKRKRTLVISLVALGVGGILLNNHLDYRKCQAEHPQTPETCKYFSSSSQSSSGGSSGGSSRSFGSVGGSDSASAAVSRGGFGGSGAAHFSSGS